MTEKELKQIEEEIKNKKLVAIKPGDPDYKFVDTSKEQQLELHKTLKKLGLL